MFKLALALGCTVKELGQRLSSDELSEWLAYDRIEPLPDPWLQTGVIASTLANSFRSKGPPSSPSDFMPNCKKIKKRQTVNQMKSAMGIIASKQKKIYNVNRNKH